jgi:hypothetical protein
VSGSGRRHASGRRVNSLGGPYAYILTDVDIVGDGRRGLSMGDVVCVFSILELGLFWLRLICD